MVSSHWNLDGLTSPLTGAFNPNSIEKFVNFCVDRWAILPEKKESSAPFSISGRRRRPNSRSADGRTRMKTHNENENENENENDNKKQFTRRDDQIDQSATNKTRNHDNDNKIIPPKSKRVEFHRPMRLGLCMFGQKVGHRGQLQCRQKKNVQTKLIRFGAFRFIHHGADVQASIHQHG